jgi:hypothetical protein
MSMLQRIRKGDACCRGFVFSGSVAILLTGCASPSGTSWQTARTYEQSPRVVSTRRNYEKTYKIQDPIHRNVELEVPVHDDTQERGIDTMEIERWERQEELRHSSTIKAENLLFSLLLMGGGYLAYNAFKDSEDTEFYSNVGAITAGIGVIGLGFTFFDSSDRDKTSAATGRTQNVQVGTRRYDHPTTTSYTRRDQPSADVPVRLRSDHYTFSHPSERRFSHSLLLNTDSRGRASVRLAPPTGNFLTRGDAINGLRNIDVISSIRHQGLRDLVTRRASDFVIEQNAQYVISTEARSKSNTTVNNASRTFAHPYYSIDATRIYPIIKRFIDENINARIRSVTLAAEDIDTRMELGDVNYILTFSAPSHRELANQYFTGALAEWASTQINQYATGTVRLRSGRDGKVSVHVYLPSQARAELRRAQYHYVENIDLTFDEGRTDKTIRMSETGSKVRINMIDGGRLHQLVE